MFAAVLALVATVFAVVAAAFAAATPVLATLAAVLALAQYAERFGDQYRRIEAVAKIDDKFRVLDLKEVATRASVSTATSIKALYESTDASDYMT